MTEHWLNVTVFDCVYIYIYMCPLFDDAINSWDYIASVTDERMSIEHWWNDTDRGKLKYWERNVLSFPLIFTTDPTWTNLRSNPGLCGWLNVTIYVQSTTRVTKCEHSASLQYGINMSYVTYMRAGRSGDRIPVRARFFASVQTGPEAYPASYTMGTGSFPGVKRPGRGADHPPPN
jgi:hypothetical protein